MSEYEAKIAKLEAVSDQLSSAILYLREDHDAYRVEFRKALDAMGKEHGRSDKEHRATSASVNRLWWLLGGVWMILLGLGGMLPGMIADHLQKPSEVQGLNDELISSRMAAITERLRVLESRSGLKKR